VLTYTGGLWGIYAALIAAFVDAGGDEPAAFRSNTFYCSPRRGRSPFVERAPGSTSCRPTGLGGKIKLKFDAFTAQCSWLEQAGTDLVHFLSSTCDERLSERDDPLHDPVTWKWIIGSLRRPEDK
jgi:hypothetical protein